MPMVYFHGVNTQFGSNYQTDRTARKQLLEHFISEPLKSRGDRFKRMDILDPYWEDFRVDFKWGLESLPDVHVLEALGSEEEETFELDIELAETINTLAGISDSHLSSIETLDANDGSMKRAAEKDLTRFLETVLLLLLASQMVPIKYAEEDPENEGVHQAHLATALEEVFRDPIVKSELAAVDSDQEVIDLLREKVLELYERSVTSRQQAVPSDEQLGVFGPSWLESIKDNVRWVFDRVFNAPSRALMLSALEHFCDEMHRNISRFLGDVFVYLNERGERANPGPIISTVLKEIEDAPRYHPDEPLIVFTHSMGGSILYDILTYYASDLKVDFWVSVGGQVAQFGEMKLFKARNKIVIKPEKVKGLKSHVGYWLKVYDSADVFSFKTASVFADVNADREYLTGVSVLKALSAYFGRASFYIMVQKHVTEARL